MQSCLALRFLVKRENGGARGRLINIYIYHVFSKERGRLGRRTSNSARTKTSARLKITFVDMKYPKGWTRSFPLCPFIFSSRVECIHICAMHVTAQEFASPWDSFEVPSAVLKQAG